jgi:uncharacterized protein YbjT (DUF2867 family)
VTIDSVRPYAVVGATGQQGGATVRALLDAGAPVRALVRDPDSARARRLVTAGAALATADLTEPASLRAAFNDVAGVFAMTTFATERGTDGEIADGIALADAAKDSRVPHVVYSSVGGADRGTGVPHFESKWRVEQYLRSTGVPTTVVRPVFFMENLAPTEQDGEMVLSLPLPGGVAVQVVAVADIGAAAAALLLAPEPLPGGAVEIAGDEVTGEQMAASFGARYQPLPLEAIDNDDLRAMFAWLANPPAYRADFAATRRLVPTVLDLPTWVASSARS